MISKIQYSEILKSVYHRIAEGGQFRASNLLPLVQKDCGFTDDQMQEVTKGGKGKRVRKYVERAISHLYSAGLTNKVSSGLYELAPNKSNMLGLDAEELEKTVRELVGKKNESAPSEPSQQSSNCVLSKYSFADDEVTDMDYSTPSFNPYDMSIGCLLAEPNTKTKDGRKALKEKQQSLAQRLEDILWAIRYYDFPIDPKEIMEKVEQHSQDKEEDFELSFDFGTINEYTGQLSKCDIYVSPCKDAVPLNIKPIFKATYLAVMLMKDGINPSKPSKEFIGLVRYIYEMLPTKGKAQDDDNGIVNDKKKFDSDWVGKQLNGIRNAVKEQIPNLLIAQKFAVEGYRNKPFTVQKADDSIRKQIRKAFLLN